jgi:hypothetical protein
MAAKKKKTTKPYGNKTKFVLGLSRDLSAKQVVDEAKKNGIVITEAHVYKIRSTAKAKGKGPSKAAKSSGRGRVAAAPKGGRGNAGKSKRDFVLGFGAETPASEILRQAKEAGIGLSKAYLYTIRSSGGASQKRGAQKSGAKTRGAQTRGQTSGRASKASSTKDANAAMRKVKGAFGTLEKQFIDAAIDMGLAKATELLSRLRSRVKAY